MFAAFWPSLGALHPQSKDARREHGPYFNACAYKGDDCKNEDRGKRHEK